MLLVILLVSFSSRSIILFAGGVLVRMLQSSIHCTTDYSPCSLFLLGMFWASYPIRRPVGIMILYVGSMSVVSLNKSAHQKREQSCCTVQYCTVLPLGAQDVII